MVEATPHATDGFDHCQIPENGKHTEFGIIPSDWDVVELGELFEISSSKRVFQKDWKTYGVPFYRARELAVLGEKGAVDNDLFIEPSLYHSFKKKYGVPYSGDLLVTGVGTLGKVYIVKGDHQFYFKDGNIIWLKCAGKISSQYLRQLYKTPLIETQIKDASAGTTVGTYTISGAKKTRIPLPPTEREQLAIADALSDTDRYIETLEKLAEKKRLIKQGAMQELLSGRRRLPGFAKEWQGSSLGDVCHTIVDGTHFTPAYVENGIPFYSVENITSGNFHACRYISKGEHGALSQRCKPERGDILLTRIGSIGDAKLIDWDVDASIYVSLALLKCGDRISSKYLAAYMSGDQFRRDIEGRSLLNASPKKINMKEIAGVPIALPSVSEQEAIATVFSDFADDIDTLEYLLAKARWIKQGMMQELLTGRVRLV